MGRSPGFGSTTHDSIALFRLAFASAPRRRRLALPCTVSRRSIIQEVRSHPGASTIGLLQLVGTWFQVLLTPLKGVLFTFQSPYWFTIGRAGVLSLGGWAPHFRSEFHELRPTRPLSLTVRLQDCHLLWSPFPERSTEITTAYGSKPWASPLSLAATNGVSVDFLSSGYLDVSVPRVRSDTLCIQVPVTPSGCPVMPGCPIRKSPDQSLFGGSPEHIAAYNVLLRLCTPRHPPCTLNCLTTFMNNCGPSYPVQIYSKNFGSRPLARPEHTDSSFAMRYLRFHLWTCQRSAAGPTDPASCQPQARGHQPPSMHPSARLANSTGADRARTGNLRVANAALSQLSYGPVAVWPGHA